MQDIQNPYYLPLDSRWGVRERGVKDELPRCQVYDLSKWINSGPFVLIQIKADELWWRRKW